MRILYDDLGLREPHGGVSRYFSELFKHLPSDVETVVCQQASVNQYMRAIPFNIPPARFSFPQFLPRLRFPGRSYLYRALARILPQAFPSYERLNQRLFLQHLRSQDFDVLHLTSPHGSSEGWGNRHWQSIIGKKPIVITVHDLIPDKIWMSDKVIRQRRFELRVAAHVIAVSENTKRDLIDFYGVDESKISVIYHGASEFQNQTAKPPFDGIRYVLYVGKRDGYKNADFFVKALAPVLKSDSSLNLVFTGNVFSSREKHLFGKLGIAHQVHQKFVADNEMFELLRNAICFVYPSKYEGFGIPILDAFAADCPVICSRCSCFPEIARDAAVYFDDGDEDGLREKVLQFASSSSLRAKYIRRGRLRVSQFSWSKAAEQTVAVYHKVLGR